MNKEEAAWMPHNERCGKPDSIGDKKRKKKPACSVGKQAGVLKNRVIERAKEFLFLYSFERIYYLDFYIFEGIHYLHFDIFKMLNYFHFAA